MLLCSFALLSSILNSAVSHAWAECSGFQKSEAAGVDVHAQFEILTDSTGLMLSSD